VKAARCIAPIIMLFIIYIMFSGSISPYDLTLGLIVSIIVGGIMGSILVTNAAKSLNPIRLLWLIAYAFKYFFVDEIRAHTDVIKRILHPKLPINPGIVRVPYHVESEYAIVTIANSITNTPGTVTVDLDTKRKYLYVHWINVKAPDEKTTYKNIVKPFEKYAKKIFD